MLIWVPSQVPQMAAAVAARVAGVDIDDVTVVVTLLGGGFGRRLEVDFVAQAVRVAMDSGGRMVWSGDPFNESNEVGDVLRRFFNRCALNLKLFAGFSSSWED